MTEDNPALDPAQARMQRALKFVVISLGALIVVILGIIVLTVLGSGGDMSDDASTPVSVTQSAETVNFDSAMVTLPAGATVEHMALGNGILALYVRSDDGTQRVLLLDLATGAVKGKIALTAP